MDYPTLTALVASSSIDEVQVMHLADKIEILEVWRQSKQLQL